MTLEEAYEWFTNELKGGKCRDGCVQCNANEIALHAIEKQIPKKVTIPACPSCNTIFLFHFGEKRKGKHCGNCGQALDWSDWCVE